ncbi:MAG: nicotinate-nucleotide adenylyltransferase [Gemmatimonadota bacterium]
MTPKRRVGLFGGTFDPPHLGHLIAAETVCETLGLDEVLWIPAGSPPHRAAGPCASAPVRLRMVATAIQGNPAFRIWAGETEREGPSYTIDTVRTLRAQGYAEDSLSLIVGADQFQVFSTWKEHGTLRELVRLAVVSRDGEGGPPEAGEAGIDPVPIPRIDISSSDIRRRRRERRSIRYLVPEGVHRIVEDEDLYV